MYRHLAQVFLPVASITRRANFLSKSALTCVHINHFNKGSRVRIARLCDLPPRHGISNGAIADIVIGIVASLILALCMSWHLWRRERRYRSSGRGIDDEVSVNLRDLDKMSLDVSALPRRGSPEKCELSPVCALSELTTNEKRFERYAGLCDPAELHSVSTQELEANDKVNRESRHQLGVAKAQDMLG